MTKLLKTLVPFTEDYMPNEIIDREVERLELRRFLEPISQSQMQLYNLLVTGGVGVGKTLLTRFVSKELPSRAYYMRLTEGDNTLSKILFKIISILGLPVSAYIPSNVALMKLSEHLNHEGAQSKATTLLVLDDFDKIPLKAVRPILHEIPRSTNWCNFLFISRVPSVLEELPADTKSTLKCRELPLTPYDKDTLYLIVKQRADLSLTRPEAIENNVLETIAQASSLSGSAREAIDILKTACILADRYEYEKVTEEHVESAMAEIERRSLQETITTLPLYHRLILESCQLYPQTYDHIYKIWKNKLSQKGLKPLSIYRFRDFVSDLKKLDLITPDVKGRGRGKGFSYYLHLSSHVHEITKKQIKLS